jgi:2-phosphosulfolactate phosphatase
MRYSGDGQSLDISIGSFSDAARAATGTAIVIDVFRAFTVAAIALQNGASRIVMVDDLDAALALRAQGVGRYCIGERGGVAPPGFDFGNSPAEMRDDRFKGDTLIQTTSNGTRGILAASGAKRLYAGSLITADATVAAILNGPPDPITIVAMGELDQNRTEEDELCALYLRAGLLGRSPDKAAVQSVIKTMSPRRDGGSISAADIACCLEIGTAPFALRVTQEDGLHVATAEPAQI